MLQGRFSRFRGVSHWDDHFYLLSSSLSVLRPWVTLPREEDRAVSDVLVALVTNFARGGNPTPGKGEKRSEK